MLNYKSVRSSEPQIRSNPALRQISSKSGFQKRLETLLEPTPIHFPTFQIMRDNHQNALETQPYYAWVRPAHLRSQWLILTHDMPLMMMDPKNPSNLWSLRIPFDTSLVQKSGPIVCEGAWDAQDHVLYIWDVVLWEKENVWATHSYKKRWQLLQTVCSQILDVGHPMSDAEVRVPQWITLGQLKMLESIDTTSSIEFQPEKENTRRLLFIVQNKDKKYEPTTHHERKMLANGTKHHNEKNNNKNNKSESPKLNKAQAPVLQIQIEESIEEKPLKIHISKQEHQKPIFQKSLEQHTKTINKQHHLSATLIKDKQSNLLDTYRLKTSDNGDLGFPAIRSLEINKQLREAFKTKEEVNVQVAWFEPFQKYEIQAVL